MPNLRIIVEGEADKKFLSDYISYLAPSFRMEEETIISSKGWTNINNQGEAGEAIRNKMAENTDNGGVNLVIFDADADFATRKQTIEEWKANYRLSFELFLFPNNGDTGALEDLLEKIILDKNQKIFNCWNEYENLLQVQEIEGRPERLTTPSKKTKIYAYLEALLGSSRKEKEQIKEINRDYKNTAHWNLNADYLNPLKAFLQSNYLALLQ